MIPKQSVSRLAAALMAAPLVLPFMLAPAVAVEVEIINRPGAAKAADPYAPSASQAKPKTQKTRAPEPAAKTEPETESAKASASEEKRSETVKTSRGTRRVVRVAPAEPAEAPPVASPAAKTEPRKVERDVAVTPKPKPAAKPAIINRPTRAAAVREPEGEPRRSILTPPPLPARAEPARRAYALAAPSARSLLSRNAPYEARDRDDDWSEAGERDQRRAEREAAARRARAAERRARERARTARLRERRRWYGGPPRRCARLAYACDSGIRWACRRWTRVCN